MSTTNPPLSRPISSAVVVVCFPLKVQSETSRTFRFKPGLDDVQERALADAALARHGRDAAARAVPEAAEAAAVGHRGDDRLVAELGVKADHPLARRQVDQVGLVEDDDRRHAPHLGRDQVAVDQAELEPGLGQGRDDEHLVDVGGDDVLAMAIAAGDQPAPGFDLLDQPLGARRPTRAGTRRGRRP